MRSFFNEIQFIDCSTTEQINSHRAINKISAHNSNSCEYLFKNKNFLDNKTQL